MRLSTLIVLSFCSTSFGQQFDQRSIPAAIPVPSGGTLFKWELGFQGRFEVQSKPDEQNFGAVDRFRVAEILSATEMILEGIREFPGRGASGQSGRIVGGTPRTVLVHKPFILIGMPTKGVVDDAKIDLSGFYKVASTKKVGTRTYFVATVVTLEVLPEPRIVELEKASPKPSASKTSAPKSVVGPSRPESLDTEAGRKEWFLRIYSVRFNAETDTIGRFNPSATVQKEAFVRTKLYNYARENGFSLDELFAIEKEGKAKKWSAK